MWGSSSVCTHNLNRGLCVALFVLVNTLKAKSKPPQTYDSFSVICKKSQMAPRYARPNGGNNKAPKFNMDENLRIAVQLKIDAFLDNPEELRLDFPSSLTAEQRGYVHNYVRLKGLKSRSYGKGVDRYISLQKRANNTKMDMEATIRLSTGARQLCQSLYDGPNRVQPQQNGRGEQKSPRFDGVSEKKNAKTNANAKVTVSL